MSVSARVDAVRRTIGLALVAALLGACASASASPRPSTGSAAEGPRRCSSAAAAYGKVAGGEAALEGASAGTAGLGAGVPEAARKAATGGLGATAEASFWTGAANAASGRLATVTTSATREFAHGSAAETCR